MGYYNRIKATKVSPIGTILPWSGSSSSAQLNEDSIPKGWIVCNSSAKGLRAIDYPLLAQIIGNTYGPFPQGPGEVVGVDIGIKNSYPNYVEDDTFDLPDLNQRALVDIEGDRLETSDLAIVGQYISENGTEGTQPDDNNESDVNIIFEVEPSTELSGRITGIYITEPVYNDTIYPIPRKLGQDHTPSHNHTAPEGETINGTISTGNPVQTFIPNVGEQQEARWTSITPYGGLGDELNPVSATVGDGRLKITWYDQNDGGISLVETSRFVNINSNKSLVPREQNRNITAGIGQEGGWTDRGERGIAYVQVEANTGPIPVAGEYRGRKNYHYTNDIPFERGGGQGEATNTNILTKVYPTTVNHVTEEWASINLRGHNHEAFEITMTRGSLPDAETEISLLVNNVSTGSAAPVSVDRALNITVNPDTPSLTMIYIMRAY